MGFLPLRRESRAALLALMIHDIVLIDLDDIRRFALRTTEQCVNRAYLKA